MVQREGSAEESPEVLGWIEILQPDEDFEGIGIGIMVSWECDLFIPNVVRIFTGPMGGAAHAYYR